MPENATEAATATDSVSTAAADSAEIVIVPLPWAVTVGAGWPLVPIRAVTAFPSVLVASTTPAARPTPAAEPKATDRLPAPARVARVGVSAARTVTDPLPPSPDPAVTVAETIPAVVVVLSSTVDAAPEPAADTLAPPPATATLTPTPKARASIRCLDSAVRETSPPAVTLPVSIAARAVLVTVTTLLAAPTVTPTAAA